jgi:hypothetical protein
MPPICTMEARSNIKGHSQEVPIPISRFNLVIGPNESHKTALVLAMTLPFTGLASDELYRSVVSGRTLKALRPEGEDTVFSRITVGELMIAEWSQKGGGNPKMAGDASGKLVDVWTTLREGLVGYAPKLGLMLMDSPRGTVLVTKEQRAAREALVSAEAELKKIKSADPGALPAIPPDPREEVLAAFTALERAANRGADCQALRRQVAEKVALLSRWKEGQRIAEAKLSFDKAVAVAKATVDARKDELVRVLQPLADTICVEASAHLPAGRKLVMDLASNDIVLINKSVPHYAPSGTLEAWMHMALGAVLWGKSGCLVIPDLQWDSKNVAAWMHTCAGTGLGLVALTLATVGKKATVSDAWNVIVLE